MLTFTRGSDYAQQFDDLPQLVDFITNGPARWSHRASRTNGEGRSWDLGAGYDGALRLAKHGWEEGICNVSALAATVPNNVEVTRTFGVAGEMPDVPRYLSGDPLHMMHRGRNKVPKPTMTLVISIGANCNVSAKQMVNFGAAMVALVDRLESRRVRVELIGVWASSCRAGRVSTSWHIKRPQDPLDLSAVAFGLGHPAMLRRLGFAAMERSPQRYQQSDYGVSVSTVKPTDLVDAPEGALYIGGVGSNNYECETMPRALEYAKTMINKAYRDAGHDADMVELEEVA